MTTSTLLSVADNEALPGFRSRSRTRIASTTRGGGHQDVDDDPEAEIDHVGVTSLVVAVIGEHLQVTFG